MAGRDADEVYKEDDIIEMLARQKETNFKPGTRRVYNNSGYVLLAAIVKRVSGKSLRQFANENIFTPLGMSDTGFQDEGSLIVRNRATDYLINVEEGKLAVSANNGMRFRIAPVSATEFREFGVPVRIDVRFERRGEGERPLMYLSIDRKKPDVFEPVKLRTPTPSELSEYAGEYYSDEAQITYKIGLENDRLIVTAKRMPKLVLAPAIKDEFIFAGFNFDFTRDAQNKVNGFLLDTERSVNVRFVRSR